MPSLDQSRAVFVDDDELVLRALRRLLVRTLTGWDLVFVGSAADALAAVATQPAHVVVTDLDMPGTDGATLLRRVQADHPDTVRIILSGSSNRDDATRTVNVAHQYLSKPVDPTTLASVLKRIFALRELLHDQRLRALVGGRNELPAAPEGYTRLLEALQRPQASIAEVCSVIEGDVGTAACVMHVASSEFSGRRATTSNLREVVELLGITVIKCLVLQRHIVELFTPNGATIGIDEVQRHARRTASIARHIMGSDFRGDDAFLAGMLHSVGRLVMANRAPDRYARTIELQQQGRALAAAEHEVFGVSHGEVGAYLLGLWGMAQHHVDAVAWCERPTMILGGELDLSVAIYLASRLAEAPETPIADVGDHDRAIDRKLVDRLGLTGQLQQWRAFAHSVAEG